MRNRIMKKEAERAIKVAHEGTFTTPKDDTNNKEVTSSKVETNDSNSSKDNGNNDQLRQRMKQTLTKANEQRLLENILKQVKGKSKVKAESDGTIDEEVPGMDFARPE